MNKQSSIKTNEFKHIMTDEVIHFAVGISLVGHILVAQSGKGICAVYLSQTPKELLKSLKQEFIQAKFIEGGLGIKKTLSKVIEYIHHPQSNHCFTLDIRGTVFQQRVWQVLSEIPPGVTVSYSQIAQKMNKSGAVRAIASACGANNIAVLIPCHRVIRKDGTLSGYRWGIVSKQVLLKREKLLSTK